MSGDAASKPLAQDAHQNSLSCFPDYRPLSGGTARAVKYEPRSATSPSFGLEDSLMAFTSHAGQDMFMPSPDSMENFNDPFSFADPPHGHNAILRADPRHHGTVDPLDLTFSASDYSTFSDWIHPDDLMHTPESQPASEADSAQMSAHRLPTSFSSSLDSSFPDTSLLQTDSHHCQKLAHATLDSLSLKQDSIARGEHLTQTMDKVLNRNKQAVDNMRQLLACPCSRSPHLAMLYASITSKILMWYQLAAGCAKPAPATATATWDSFPPPGSSRRHQPTPPLSASSSPAATSAAPASPVGAGAQAHKGGGFVVTPMQFSAGAFSVDDEAAQEALRTQLLLSELRKAGNLIDLLCLQGGSGGRAGEAAAATAPGEVSDIYSALGTWLKCELNRTVGSLQS
ncbi:putativelike c6 zinc cluster transcription [Diaporthe ampelina]|uniref:Putativelike c6 zinc cluster transcription n=1 Tax=Diaporthe ampelina TaxID=1214573 RepID=A0A0G2I5I9_9PEZI|nr:putativelike c6 zinc cluster transcription [Diaporthe ampelina]